MSSVHIERDGETVTVSGGGVFEASECVEALSKRAGFSIGISQKGAPRGPLFGRFAIQKWRNLVATDRQALHGTLSGDVRRGPVSIRFSRICPAGAHDAFEAELSWALVGAAA